MVIAVTKIMLAVVVKIFVVLLSFACLIIFARRFISFRALSVVYFMLSSLTIFILFKDLCINILNVAFYSILCCK